MGSHATEAQAPPSSACAEGGCSISEEIELPDIDQDIQRLRKEEERLKAASLWHPLTHDRRIELVFIGDRRMQQDAIQAAVEAATLTKEELREFLDTWDSGMGPASELRVQVAESPFANVPGPARGLWT